MASPLGATLAFLLSRFLFRERLRALLSPGLDRIDRGIADEGAFFLFTLRLVPLVPF
jgi:uncharacterized membrane protein YdjX (TVP38/TMEM64 family)